MVLLQSSLALDNFAVSLRLGLQLCRQCGSQFPGFRDFSSLNEDSACEEADLRRLALRQCFLCSYNCGLLITSHELRIGKRRKIIRRLVRLLRSDIGGDSFVEPL